MPLEQMDMIAEFEIQGYTAIPHPYVKEWIAMPLHHKVEAQHLADHHGWEWVPMGWKPKTENSGDNVPTIHSQSND